MSDFAYRMSAGWYFGKEREDPEIMKLDVVLIFEMIDLPKQQIAFFHEESVFVLHTQNPDVHPSIHIQHVLISEIIREEPPENYCKKVIGKVET